MVPLTRAFIRNAEHHLTAATVCQGAATTSRLICVKAVFCFFEYVFDQSAEGIPVSFTEAEAFNRFVSASKARSMFVSNVEASLVDSLVTMVTCDFERDNNHMLLVGKLM